MRSGPWRKIPGCALLALAAGLLASAVPVGSAAALDFDLFGLFGRREEPPPPNPATLPYAVEIAVVGDADLKAPLRDVSTLYRLRSDAPPDAEALVRRAQADLVPLIDALWGRGYYNARLAIEVAGVPLRLRAERADAAVRAAEAYRARALVPVRIVVDPGRLFVLRDIALRDAATGQPLTPEFLPPSAVRLDPGDPARSAAILAAQARIVDYYRAQSRPFAKVTEITPIVYHPEGVVDVTMRVEPGPVAGIGPIAIEGLQDVDPRVIRSFIYTEPGDPYSPKALASMRRSVQKLEAISSVRIREADQLDPSGNLPLVLAVSERKPRVIGASVRYSTLDGPALRAYWAHRNLFGGAEHLRLEANAFYLTQDGARPFDADDGWYQDLGARLSASFMKPALGGTRNDFIADAVVARDRTEGYTSHVASLAAGIRHRFGERFSVQAGLEAERGRTTDILGRIDYTLVGLPAALEYDSRDDLLNPTQGLRAAATVTPYPEALGSSVGFLWSQVQGSAYFALDDEARYVLAGRIGFGSILGADLEAIPANRRFFAGGGGSVRGFPYKSLGPDLFGEPIGGRSLLEGSLEARIRVTETIGIVPFVDAGNAFRSSYPDFSEPIRVAAGIGLRYHTGIGPIRLDVATPLNPENGGRPVAVYLGIGQAF